MNPANNLFPTEFQANEVQGTTLVLLFLDSLFLISAFKSAIGFSLVDIKSQILIPFSVAALTHCNLGLNEIWLMVEPASNCLNGSFKSLMSQMLRVLSFPPVAKYFPFGLIETELAFPSWALKVYLI